MSVKKPSILFLILACVSLVSSLSGTNQPSSGSRTDDRRFRGVL